MTDLDPATIEALVERLREWGAIGGPDDWTVFAEAADTIAAQAAEIQALRAERDRLQQAVDAVQALHAPIRLYPEFRFAPWCAECSTGIRGHGDDGSWVHQVSWPCATAVALGMRDPLAAALGSATPKPERVVSGLPESQWADEERAAGLDYDDLAGEEA